VGELVLFGEIGVERLFPPPQRLHHLRQAVIGLRPHDKVHHRLAAHDLFALGLRDTSRHADLEVGVRLPQGFEAAKLGIDLFRRLLADVAGVQEDHVRALGRCHLLIPFRAQRLGHAFAVVDVHLTAVGLDVELLRPGHGAPANGFREC
jgi:hypothetical protein